MDREHRQGSPTTQIPTELDRVEFNAIGEGKLVFALFNVVMDGVETGCSAAGGRRLIDRSCHAVLALFHRFYVRVERGLPENLQAHLRKLVQPALGQ